MNSVVMISMVPVGLFLVTLAIAMVVILGAWFGAMFTMVYTWLRMGAARLISRDPEHARSVSGVQFDA